MYYVRSLAVVLAVLLVGEARSAEPVAKFKELFDKVAHKLIASADPVPGFEWPPSVEIMDCNDVNAFATFEAKGGKKFPQVRVCSGMMTKVVRGDEDILALIIAHEFGHISQRHIVINSKRDRTEFLRITYGREQELEADVTGAELMLKAGFNLKKGVKYIDRMNELGLKFSSLEGLGDDHPSWNDRMSRLDKIRPQLWKSLSAFDNGTAFLMVEQYALAEDCFERVIKEFPDSYEAWVNLGNACLMRYFDKFDLDDIKFFGVGQVMAPGFYPHADSISQRGIDNRLWKKAVDALTKALDLKKDLTLARSNLGLAYLFHPDGTDMPNALKYAQAAADEIVLDSKASAVHAAAVLLNLGVIFFAAGDDEKGFSYVDRAQELAARDSGSDKALQMARNYTAALVLSRHKEEKDQRIARSMFERYLRLANSTSIWWEAAYEQYKDLSARLTLKVEPMETFKPEKAPLRPALGYTLKSGGDIKLTDETAELLKKLGPGEEKSVIPGTRLKRIRYEKEGVDLLVNDSVVAICLTANDAAPIKLRGKGTASKVVMELKIGMSMADAEQALGDGEKCFFVDPGVEYTYYRSHGIGIRRKGDLVAEIVLATIPRKESR